MSVNLTRLDNGLTVVTDTMDRVETVSLGIWVAVGTRYESPEANGISHMLEHMAFKGTRRRSARAIAEEIEAVGGHINAYTGRETTAYYAKVLKEDAGLALDILADILQHSVFDDGELVKERDVILQEIGQAHDTPDDIIFDHFQETAFPTQALGKPVLGRPEIVQAIGRPQLFDHLTRHYQADRMVLAAAGKLDHDAIVAKAQALFAGLPRGGNAVPQPGDYRGGEFREESDLEQIHLVLGLPGLALTDPDQYALAAFTTVLGGGMSSRLFQEVREKRGLVYSVYSFHSGYADCGLFGLYAGTGTKHVKNLMPLLFDEVRACADKVTEAELARAKAQMKADVLMSLESTGARAEQLARQMAVYGRPIPTAEIVSQIEALAPADLKRVAARILAGPLTLAAMGPIGKLESFEAMAARLKA